MPRRLTDRLPAAGAALAGALALGGCLEDENVYSSGGDAATRRAAQAVVVRNLTALERGDGEAYCSTYTPGWLREYRGGWARCVAAFERRNPRAPAPRIRFTDFLTATDEKVAVSFRPAGKGSVQTYYLRLAAPVPQAGTGRRWLIETEAVERD